MKENKIYLLHIIESIEKTQKYIENETYKSFSRNDLIIDGVLRNFEIIGEAACKIDDEFQEKNSQIPWSKMIAMRNKLIHEYFGVDKKVVWETVKNDLPELKKAISDIL